MSEPTKEFITRLFLSRLMDGDATIPRKWRSIDIYERLVSEGLAAPVLNVGPLARGYSITQAGRQWLKDNPKKG